MSLLKPYKRTVRQLTDGSYKSNGNGEYILHPEFSQDPQHYIRAFLIIQEDLQKLFQFVEPCDQNLETVSLKIQELLTRVCIEIEANFTAILKENGYTNTKNWNLRNDYCLIEFSHRLSAYKVKFPIWKGNSHTRIPFQSWANKSAENWHALTWYQAFNKSKHDRHAHFGDATLNNLLDAVSGLVVILSSQFMNENYSPNEKLISWNSGGSYDYEPNMESTIGSYFRVQYPLSWDEDDKYGFNWQDLKSDEEPINSIDYDKIRSLQQK